MNIGIVKMALALAALLTLVGCAPTAVEEQSRAPSTSMISAAEFAEMINIEVKVLEPTPAEEAML